MNVAKLKRELVFSVREIQEKGGLTFAKTLSAEDFVEEGPDAWNQTFGRDCLSGNFNLKLEFSVGGSNLLVDGKVEGRWSLTCSRCLAPHEMAFETAVEETYPLTNEVVDVWQEVRESLSLSVPGKSLCSPTCLGLCPQCGKDLNKETCSCRPVAG